MDPAMADAWSNLGSAYHHENDLEDALGWCVLEHGFPCDDVFAVKCLWSSALCHAHQCRAAAWPAAWTMA